MNLSLSPRTNSRGRQRWLLAGVIVAVMIGLGGAALTGGGRAIADTSTIDFDGYTLGTINGQDGWSSTGPYDREVVVSGGGQALRISNAVTSGAFGDQTFSKSLTDEAGETTAANGGMSGGTRQTQYESEFTLSSTVPGAQQSGLSMSVSPDRGDGARMSYLRFEDQPDGIHVFFDDYQDVAPLGTFTGDTAGCGAEDLFVETDLATLDRSTSHTVEFVMQFVDGTRNDVVKIYLDGNLEATGTSWEDYFLYCEGNPTRTVDSLLFRTAGTAAPATAGFGFLIDDLNTTSSTPPQCTTTCYVDDATGNNANGGTGAVDAKKTIQAAVNQVSAGGSVIVAAGTYNEDVTVSTANVELLGAGIDTSYVVGPIGGSGTTIFVQAGGVVIDGFTVTRAGNNVAQWNLALNSAGVAVQGQGNTVELRNSKLTGNRSGVDINNSDGNSIHNNIIDNNRTGMIFRNRTDNTSVLNNFITNNWTIGVLFLDGSGGTNVPVQSAASSAFSDNNISGNWYGQVEDRQAGGSIPAAPANPKNFELNWWGTTAVAVSTVQGGEPGYAAQIPVVFGGSAVAPGGQPEIKGTSSANIDYDPMQCSGVDTSAAVGFQPAGVLCAAASTTVVTASNMLANGWVFYNDETDVIDPTLGSFVTGPGTPPLGTGSAQISVSGTQRRNLATYQFAGTVLSDISALRFRTYNPSAGNGGAANRSAYLNFNVDFNGSDTFQRRLVYVPRTNGTVIQNTWQEWDAINGGAALWTYSGATWPITGGSGTTPKTWAQILTDYPGVRIRVTDAFMGMRVGEPYSDGYTENIDTFTFGSPAGTTIFNFEDTPQCTTICYVNGTTGNDAFDGSTPTSAKKTIQGGVNQVSVSGTVQVAAGTFNENVTIPKSLTLAGDSQTTTIVRPAISNPDCNAGGSGSICAGGGAASNIILVQANDVTIHDIGLDGDNPALVSGIVQSGADLNARNGIITNHALGVYQNLVVHHTTIKNIYLRGIYASSGGSFNFHHDTVQNVKAEAASIGMFNFGGAGTFADNNVSDTNDAISSNWSTGSTYTNNVVTDSGSGVHTDNNGGFGGVADSLSGNTVTNCKVNGYGVWVFAPYLPVTVSQNKVTNCAVGLTSAGQQAPATVTFTDNEVDGQNLANSTGVYVTTSLFGFGDANSTVVMTGNIIKNNVDGFYLEANPGFTTTLDASRNSITGNTGTGVSVGVTGTLNAKMTGNWWGSATGPTHALNPGGTGNSVVNGIPYSPWIGIGTDASPATTGYQMVSPMTWVAGVNVCDVTCIQKAVDYAVPGDTINALAGTFNEQVKITESNLLINGAGVGLTFVKPSGVVANTTRLNGNPTAAIFDIETSTGVNIQNLTADGSLNGIGSCTPDFLGFYYKKASGQLTNVAASHIRLSLPLLGCQSGVGVFVEADSPDVANVQVNNASITDYQKGGVTANRTGTTISVSNSTVTGIGPTNMIAANGIQVGFGATGTLTNNNVSGNDYTPNTAASTGILLFQASNSTVTGNNIHDNMEGLYVQESDGVIVSTNGFAATRDTAIFVYLSNGGTYSGNTLIGQPASTGMWVYDDSAGNSVTGNAFRVGDFGIIVDFTGTGAPAANLFNGNCLQGNYGAGVETLGTLVGPKVDATGNWWGAVDGASPPGSGDSIIPGDGSTIDASGFLLAPVAGCIMAGDFDGDTLSDVSEVTIHGTDWQNPDTDFDGCWDGKELGPAHLAGGERNPKYDGAGQWDFFDVPAPAGPTIGIDGKLVLTASSVRNKAVTLQDVGVVLAYVGRTSSSIYYTGDNNGDGFMDGQQLDRTPSVVPAQLWHAGPPNGAVTLQDVAVALAQSGTTCP